jgi:hypothetical protein
VSARLNPEAFTTIPTPTVEDIRGEYFFGVTVSCREVSAGDAGAGTQSDSPLHVWLSAGVIVTAGVGRVVLVVPPGEGEEAMHPERRRAPMQRAGNTRAVLAIYGKWFFIILPLPRHTGTAGMR